MVAELEHVDDNLSLYGKNVSRTRYVLRSLNPEKFPVVNVLFEGYSKLCFYLSEQCPQKSFTNENLGEYKSIKQIISIFLIENRFNTSTVTKTDF